MLPGRQQTGVTDAVENRRLKLRRTQMTDNATAVTVKEQDTAPAPVVPVVDVKQFQEAIDSAVHQALKGLGKEAILEKIKVAYEGIETLNADLTRLTNH